MLIYLTNLHTFSSAEVFLTMIPMYLRQEICQLISKPKSETMDFMAKLRLLKVKNVFLRPATFEWQHTDLWRPFGIVTSKYH